MCVGLVACGGGGGGDADPTKLGLAKVTVTDAFGAGVAGAKIEGPLGTATTDQKGEALVLVGSPGGSASVTVSRPSFEDKPLVVTSTPGQVNEVPVTLDRVTAAAGGSLRSRSGVLPAVDGAGQLLTFEIELIVVDGDARPIENLTSAQMTLQPCTPAVDVAGNECVRGASGTADVAYTAVTPTPDSLQKIAGGVAKPYAAALLLDQSGSIFQTDPTGARVFSAKAFLSGLNVGEFATVSAFADGAGVPTPPLTPYVPFRAHDAALSFFPTLDLLTPLSGGGTPLYQSIDTLRQSVVGDVSVPGDVTKALVIFTDGEDSQCGTAEDCRLRREQSIKAANDDQVRLFTIGMSSRADIQALGELADRTGGIMLYAAGAEQLVPLYGTVADLLNLSLPTYRLRWTVRAGEPGAFRSGSTLLGRVQVAAGGETFDVPFIVAVP
jgi:hypothetical protein